MAHYTGYIKGTSEKDIQISEMNINEAKMITEFTLKEVEYKSKIIKLELKTDSLKKVINDNDYGKQ